MFHLMEHAGHQRHQCLCQYRHLYRDGEYGGIVVVIFLEKDEHGSIKDMDVAKTAFLRALAFVVEHRGGQIVIFHAATQHSV